MNFPSLSRTISTKHSLVKVLKLLLLCILFGIWNCLFCNCNLFQLGCFWLEAVETWLKVTETMKILSPIIEHREIRQTSRAGWLKKSVSYQVCRSLSASTYNAIVIIRLISILTVRLSEEIRALPLVLITLSRRGQEKIIYSTMECKSFLYLIGPTLVLCPSQTSNGLGGSWLNSHQDPPLHLGVASASSEAL